MPRTREEIQEERHQLKNEYGQLFDSISAVLFGKDPVGINFEVNPDEYEPETGTILPRLRTCNSADDILHVVHEEFLHWFGVDTAGSRDNYRVIADEIWHLYEQWRPRHR